MNDDGVLRRLIPALAAALIAVSLATPILAESSTSQARAVSGFNRVRLQGPFATEIAAGQHGTRVVVSGDSNVVARITTEVHGDTLVVGMRPGIDSFNLAPKVQIALPALRGITNEGAGSITITGLTGADVDIENAGVGSIVASGLASRENISLNGLGKIDATAVEARDVTVNNSGVGAVRVHASSSLTMKLNGVGKIGYAGNPPHVESHVEGIGKIERL